MSEPVILLRPFIQAAAERRGIRTDGVMSSTYLLKGRQVTVRYWDGSVAVFKLRRSDFPKPCPHCGRS